MLSTLYTISTLVDYELQQQDINSAPRWATTC